MENSAIGRQWSRLRSNSALAAAAFRSYEAEKFVYVLIGQGRRWQYQPLTPDFAKLEKFLIKGHAKVQLELNPMAKAGKHGRPRGSINRKLRTDIEEETVHKRKQRGNLWNPNLSNEEFGRRWTMWITRRQK
jgi:hypothetical protein